MVSRLWILLKTGLNKKLKIRRCGGPGHKGNIMTITVAGNKKEVKEGLTLPELIQLENVETPEYVTVSINEEFIQKDEEASLVLKEGDSVEFLYFMGGGAF